jgi:hypothetical protein
MALSNWAFATTFVIAIAVCLLVILIVWHRRPKQDGSQICWRPAAQSAFARSSNGGLIVAASALANLQRSLIVELAASHRLPAV